MSDNFSFAETSEATIAQMIRAVVAEGCDAVALVCTNMRGAGLAQELETELGVPIYDSVAVTLWKSMILAGTDPANLIGWGFLFSVRIGAQSQTTPRSIRSA